MKLKIFLAIFLGVLGVFFTAEYLLFSYSQKETVATVKKEVSRATSLYKYINKAETLSKINEASELASRQTLIDAIDFNNWKKLKEELKSNSEDTTVKTSIKKIQDSVQIELDIINKLYDKSDMIFIVDSDGDVISKNLDGILDGKNFLNKILIQSALKGRNGEDVFKILGKVYKVVAVPIRNDQNFIIGAYCSANIVDSEMAKDDAGKLYEETVDASSTNRFYFAFIGENNKLYGSNLSPEKHETLRKYIETHSIAKLINKKDKTRKTSSYITLNGEKFFADIAVHPSLDGDSDVYYMILSSVDKSLQPLKARNTNFIFFTIFILILGFIIAFVFDESFNKPINNFMEGMLEIINGNTSYKFDNEADGIEGSLNQNANYMISVLLGEKNQEDVQNKES
jgi:hypothetical protein